MRSNRGVKNRGFVGCLLLAGLASGGFLLSPAHAAVVVVNSLTGIADGDTSSIPALINNPGPDRFISIVEAVDAANHSTGADTISFSVNGTIRPGRSLDINDTTGGLTILGDNRITIWAARIRLYSDNNVLDKLVMQGLSADRYIWILANHNVVRGCTLLAGYGRTTDGPEGIFLAGQAGQNIIGGGSEADGNVIGGMYAGIWDESTSVFPNYYLGNRIGVQRDGHTAIPNFIGALIDGSMSVEFGGYVPSEGNIVSGNTHIGLIIKSGRAGHKFINSNKIGTDATGQFAVPNGSGIYIEYGQNAEQAADVAISNNLVSGNQNSSLFRGAITVSVPYHVSKDITLAIWNNRIGTDITGELAVPNDGDGIFVDTANADHFRLAAGKSDITQGNIIAFNKGDGVSILGGSGTSVELTSSRIFSNAGRGIVNPSSAILPPRIFGRAPVSGSAERNAVVQVFADAEDEGRYVLGLTVADATGRFSLPVDLSNYQGLNLTATATRLDLFSQNKTSEFSSPLAVVEAPRIVQQPVSSTVDFGEDAVFRVSATPSLLNFRWQRGTVDLEDDAKYSGAHSPVLTVHDCINADEGYFRCRVEGEAATTMSNSATLTVSDPIIVSEPRDLAVAFGETAQFTVRVEGSGDISYHWIKGNVRLEDGAKFQGTTTNTLRVLSAQADPLNSDVAAYRCEILGGDPLPVLSRQAFLTVVDPGIAVQPQPRTANRGDTVTFSVKAIGTPPILYSWRKNGATLYSGPNISGTRTPELTLTHVNEANEGDYSCVVIGRQIVYSQLAGLEVADVNDELVLLKDLRDALVEADAPFAWEILVGSDGGNVSYQWMRAMPAHAFEPVQNNERILGADSPVLRFDPVAFSDAGQYRVDFTNGQEARSSSIASLVVVAQLSAFGFTGLLIVAVAMASLAALQARQQPARSPLRTAPSSQGRG